MNLDLLFNAITEVAKPLIKEKIQRNETVIKLLKQFNLDPEHPPADFSDIYAYTLVEYGLGKPKPLLEIFRQEVIKKAFRKAFDHNNPSILLTEIDAFVEAYALGDEVKDLRIDIRREIAAFYLVFAEVAKRSRKPAETLIGQEIISLQQLIINIQEKIDRQPTLESLRIEIARLATQSYPLLSAGIETNNENKCRAIALAEKMRGWFETLGYQLEKYEVWAEDYFEFIINIPKRRSFDRILIRGIAGEVGLKDIVALQQSVEGQKTDEGWLVTTRRISRVARDEVKKEENRHLDCFTFDELIDLDADFTGYVDWLEKEIKRRKVDTNYVALACSKEEIDPITKRQIGVSRYEEEDGWIDGYIDLWLDDPVKEHISVLGEFGTGKTWFSFHYAWVALQRYKDAQKRGLERPRLPLVITLRDFAKALNVENVLAGFFFSQHNIRINSDVFDQLNRMGKLLLIFDGFDEMAAKVDRQQMINNFWELAKVVVPGAKVILTCRTEHFPEAQEGRALLNAELQASTKQLTGETPQFEVLELEKFNDEQIRQVLSFQAETKTVDQVMGNPQLIDLARRPVMTELILEALPDIEAGKPVDMARVYLYAVRRKIERDIKSDRTFTSLADKLYFLCELSWEMLSTDEMSLNYKLFPDRIRRLFGVTEKDLDHWHYDMMAQTMLIRNANGDYTPAHRSLLEFFVAYKFAGELGILASDFTELVQAQSCLSSSAEAVDYTWSGYFARQLDETGVNVAIAPLRVFVSESLEKLRETFGRQVLTKAVMDLLAPMLGNVESLINVIEGTRGRSEDEAGYVGGNAATLAVRVDSGALEGRDFSGAVIRGADFSGVSLRNIKLDGAFVKESIFTKVLGRVLSITFSSDGQFFVTGEASCLIRLWLTKNSENFLTLQGHTDWVRSVAISSGGKLLVSGSDDKTVKIWSIEEGKCLKTLSGHTSRVYSVAISNDASIVISGSSDRTIKIWDISTGECLKTLIGHLATVYSIAICPNTSKIVSGSWDETIKIWDFQSGECLKTLYGHKARVLSIAISPSGKKIISGGNDTTINLWDINTGKIEKKFPGHRNKLLSIKFSIDGEKIVSAGLDQVIKVWDIHSGECLKTLQGHSNYIWTIDISPDNKNILSASSDSSIKFWDISTGECVDTIHGHSSMVYSVCLSSDSKMLASSGDDGLIKLWDFKTGKHLKTLQGHKSRVWSVAINSESTLLASGGGDSTVIIWDISTGESRTIMGEQKDKYNSSVYSVAISEDSSFIVVGSGESSKNTVKIWDISSGECIQNLQGHTGRVWSVAISHDNSFIASCSDDKTIRLWDIKSGECIRVLQGHDELVNYVLFSHDSKFIFSGSSDQTIKIWDIASGKCLKTLKGHDHRVLSIDIISEFNIASSSSDQTIKIWDIYTGECLKTLQGHNNSVWSITVSDDGSSLVSGSWDGTIKFWDIKSGSCFRTIDNRPYAKMNITGVKGLTDAEISTLKALGAVEDGRC
jgi:predicted NACHT family NTPase